jgi:aspartyl/glutamyl-tRNA(asn/gln) amidotransferase subunit B
VAPDKKIAANWVMGEVASKVNAQEGMCYADAPVTAAKLADILRRLADGTINGKGAKQIFSLIWEGAQESVDALIEKKGLKQISDSSAIEAVIDEVLANNAKMVEEFRAGKQKAFNALVGQAMKATRGKANPKQVNEILTKKLNG